VEVAPAYDVAEITALAAATMGWEYLCLLAEKK
jgi:arginase family enzyme